MAYLGPASLQPYARHILRMAGQRLPGILLLCCATPHKSAGFEPQAGMVSLLDLEFCGNPLGMGVGGCRFKTAAGVGGVSASRRCLRRPCLYPDGLRVRPAIF